MSIPVRAICLALLLCAAARASDIAVELISPPDDRGEVRLRVRWSNAWRHERNHDGAWVFLKCTLGDSPRWRHGAIEACEPDGGPEGASATRSADGAGLFVASPPGWRGDIEVTVRARLAGRLRAGPDPVASVRPFALEMVHVPGGPYWLGGTDERAIREFAAFHAVGPDGGPAGPYRVEDESPISIGREPGSLFYLHGAEWSARYEGDQAGPVPGAFPKGTRGFWIMKYEISQGEYAAMLNTLGDAAANFRSIHGGPEYADHRGTIRLEGGAYVAGVPGRACNYVSWDDGCAFADWAALRPMTELEFAKACRGPDEPVARDFPWGTSSKARLLRDLEGDDLRRSGGADESLLEDGTREVLGASYYWVMDLAGSAWERCVTIGHPAGRAFEGTHGDGATTEYGSATNADWPRGDDDGGGYGYRGGGHYERGREYEADGFNPHSPVAWRRFGSWGAAPRSKAYGFRCVRTADG